MKILLLGALVLVAISASASDYSRKELLEIDASSSAKVINQVTVSGVNVSILNICVKGDYVQTIAPVSVCTSYGYVDSGENGSVAERQTKVCMASELKNLSQPLSYEKPYCKRFKAISGNLASKISALPGSCAVWGVKQASSQTTFFPEINKQNQGGTETLYTGVKKYSLPSCE